MVAHERAPSSTDPGARLLTRRALLLGAGRGAAAVGLSLALGSPFAAAARAAAVEAPTYRLGRLQTKDKIRWVSPRGTLEVVDDYLHTIALKMGYFDELNLDPQFEPGPIEATATTKLVAEGQADVGYPSPGVLSLSLEAGIPVVSVFEMGARDVFSFSVKPDSPITDIKQLAGKTISLGSAGWQAIADPILKIAGVDPSTVKYVEAGTQWGQAVEQGQADAALSWQGLIAQWEGSGLKLRHFEAKDFSPFPANSFVIRRADWEDPSKKDLYVRFFKASAMGLEWGRYNIRGAAQLSAERFPALRQQMDPAMTTLSCVQLAGIFHNDETLEKGWGWHPIEGWRAYFQTIRELKQITRDIAVEDVIKNDWIPEANDFDKERVRTDAKNFQLSEEYAAVPDPGLV